MRGSLSVLPEMFAAGSTTPAGSRCSKTFGERCKAPEMSPSFVRVFFVSASVRDSHISNMLSKELPSARCRRWLYEDIKEARFMRFLLEVKHANANPQTQTNIRCSHERFKSYILLEDMLYYCCFIIIV